MPPKNRITSENIVAAAAELVRRQGDSGLNARALANILGCSTQPIFSNFESMEQVRGKVIEYAAKVYDGYINDITASGKYPAYKSSGMAYIAMAKEEKELFKLLFMRDRAFEPALLSGNIDPVIEIIQQATGMSYEKAERFHLEMWVVVHGIATMIATNYLDWDMEMASDVLTDIYQGLLKRFEVM